ncbi:hypothetical protein BD311DRAFT_681408 [Dichomitus squalens]|uniref:C3H1-type domain-containing protein n=1 Tax=Dichomitus squalens TaxID=114155 RepID=A0A4Q9N3B0_9APHY|nr:hypothetical protein BD311DRAFT_681408 [Dichomitus squalens]
MLYDPDTANHLKPWLIRTLEPICDAEPSALADYILALLKHQAPESELRKELIAQLEEFLEKECPPFVDTLFTALRTKSYLPYSATASSSSTGFASSSAAAGDSGIPIPVDALLSLNSSSPERSRKRGIDDDYDQHGPSKGARLSHDGQFSRYGGRGRGDDRSSWGGRGDRGARMELNGGRADYMDGGMQGMQMNANGRGGQGYRPPEQRRGICRDYHNNGYCARGVYCKYSHGDDAVIPSQLFPMGPGGMPFLPMMGPGGMPFPINAAAGGVYDPHERMDMRPMGGMGIGRGQNARPAVLPRTEDRDSSMGQNPGELPVIQDLTPQVPIEDVSPHNSGEAFRQQQQALPMDGVVPTGEMNGGGPAPYLPGPSTDGHAPQQRPYNANGRGGGRGRGRGIFGGDAQSFRPTQKRDDKTLVVEKIPEDRLSLGAVNDWFSKFGTVTNVAVDAASAKALVSFTNHEDAHKAWKSEEAVFGNRFVKVFWHRPMEGHGQVGQRMLAASANVVAQRAVGTSAPTSSAAAPEGSPAPQPPTTSAAPASRTPSSSSSAAAALAAKQKLLEQQIAEQKSLMSLLTTASPEEKKQIMARLRKLGEEMKPSPTPAAASSSLSPPAAPSFVPPKRAVSSTPRTEDQERAERERLDKELELQRAEGDGEEESTEELKAKLEKLKAEAASLGIPVTTDTSSSYGSSTYRPYRGRGRGGPRSFYRGATRGGPPRASMKLDNRPKKLLVKGASAESLQAVRDWYETTGQVESVETTDGGDVLVSFRSRAAAEQGFAKGSHIALVGPVQVSWFTGHATGTLTQAPSAATASSGTDSQKNATVTHSPSAPADDTDSHMLQEEVEPEAGGWAADEDGFGMM